MDMKDVDQKEKNKDLKKLQFVITLIMVMSISITGATYAFFAVSANNTTAISGTAATVNLTLNVTKVFPASGVTNTGAMVPQLTGNPLVSALKGTGTNTACVDANGNIACQVYKINIKNNGGTATQVVDGRLFFYKSTTMTEANTVSSTMPNLKWKLVSSVDESTPANSTMGSDTDRAANADEDLAANEFISNLSLVKNAEQTYYIIVWINETNGDQVDKGQSFYGKVLFESSNGTGVTSTFTS